MTAAATTAKASDERASSGALSFLRRSSVLTAVLAIFALSVVIVSPSGEFPLNDDWIHARVVQNLLEQGRYTHHPYVTATLVAQVYWGALFAWLFGMSFTVLRVSTLVMAVLGGWAVGRAAETLGVGRGLSVLAAVVCAANPLMLNLSYSFMTDVPFLAMCSLSGWCFLVFLRNQDARLLAASSAFSVLAFLTRQTGVMVSAAAFVVLLLLHALRRERPKLSHLVAFGAPWLGGALAYAWLSRVLEKATPMLLGPRTALVEAMEGIRYYPILFGYLGFLALPFLAALPLPAIGRGPGGSKQARRVLVGFLAAVTGLILLPRVLYLAKLWLAHHESPWLGRYAIRMPLLGYDYVRDLAVSFPHLPNETPQPPLSIGGWWWPITAGALLVAGFFFVGAVRALGLRPLREERPTNTQTDMLASQRLFLVVWFVAATASLYNPFRGVSVVDRYFLGGLAPFVLLLVSECQRWISARSLRWAFAGTLFFWAFGLVCVQDYLAWNRTAWVAQRKLLDVYRVPSSEIRGEDTFQGWYNSETYMQKFRTRNFWSANRTRLGPWTFGDTYVVTATDSLDGYAPLERFSYFTWLGMKERTITIFKRTSAAVAAPSGA